MSYSLFMRNIITTSIVAITVTAQADDVKVLDKALRELRTHGITVEIKDAAVGYDCALRQCPGVEIQLNAEEEAKNYLIAQAKNAPAPYKTGAFQCINDSEVCNRRQEKHTISCNTALIVCFAAKLVDSYKPNVSVK